MNLNIHIVKEDSEFDAYCSRYYYDNFYVGYTYHTQDQLPLACIVIGAKYHKRLGKHVPIHLGLGEFKSKSDAHVSIMRAIINDDVVKCIIDNSPNKEKELIKETT